MLEKYDEDFIVAEEGFNPQQSEEAFFNKLGLKNIDPAFTLPEFRFNMGQLVFTSGLLKRKDFNGLIDWNGDTARNIRPEVFKCKEQGIVNYILLKKMAAKEITLRRVRFRIGRTHNELNKICIDQMTKDAHKGFIIHWSGLKTHWDLKNIPRHDIILHFERMYYKKIKYGSIIRLYKIACIRLRRIKHVIANQKISFKCLKKWSEVLVSDVKYYFSALQ
ncbi:MAG: hypothetical protein JW946_02855 [Candidatus Omnitrophica bacterium]|nr:hypothetical protein [Candidatus Omnitrophota bacterium]